MRKTNIGLVHEKSRTARASPPPAAHTTETLPYRSSFAFKASKRARSVLIRAPVRVRVVRVRALECGAAVEQRVDQATLHDAHAAAAWMGSGSGAARSVTFQSSGTALFGPSQRRALCYRAQWPALGSPRDKWVGLGSGGRPHGPQRARAAP
jgi:hypothetical protein